jgi:hypothetical protein
MAFDVLEVSGEDLDVADVTTALLKGPRAAVPGRPSRSRSGRR